MTSNSRACAAILFLGLAVTARAAEQPIAPPRYIPAAGEQRSPVAISDGTDFFVLWADSRSRLAATRVTAAGQVLDPTGIHIDSSSESAVPLWTGDEYLVLVNDVSPARLAAMRIDRDGQVIAPLDTVLENAFVYHAATSGPQTLIVYQTADRFAVRTAFLDTTGRTLTPGPDLPSRPSFGHRVIGTNAGFLVAWYAEGGAVEAVRITSAGRLLDTTPQTLFAGVEIDDRPNIASNGDGYLLAIATPDGLFMRQLSSELEILSTARIDGPSRASITAVGAGYVVALDAPEAGVHMIAVDRSGKPEAIEYWFDRSVTASPPEVASNGRDVLAVWSRLDAPASEPDVVGSVFRPSGSTFARITPQPFVLSWSAVPQGGPAMAAGHDTYLAAWGEGDPGEPSLVVSLRDKSGRPRGPGFVRRGAVASPIVLFDGTRYLVAWLELPRTVKVLQVSPETGLPLGLETEVPIQCPIPFAAATNGRETLFACGNPGLSVSVARISNATVTPIDTTPHTFRFIDFAFQFDAAWTGSGWVVTWHNYLIKNWRESSVFALALSSEAALRRGPFVVAGAGARDAIVASNGIDTVVAFTRQVDNTLARIQAVRLTPDGEPQEATTIAETPGLGQHVTQSIVWNGSQFVIAWAAETGIYGARLSAQSPSRPFLIAPANPPRWLDVDLAGSAALYSRHSPEPEYGSVSRVFFRDLGPPARARAVRH